jgi:hypothetical protein
MEYSSIVFFYKKNDNTFKIQNFYQPNTTTTLSFAEVGRFLFF